MYRKQFIKLAQILKESKTKKEIINKIALFCYEQNDKFDGYRFELAV